MDVFHHGNLDLPPPKSNELIPKMMVFKMYLLSNMDILGIHVIFRGCRKKLDLLHTQT